MSSFNPTLTDVALFSAGVLLVWRYLVSKKSSFPNPPGPRGYPIIGNLLDMPSKEQYKAFSEMGYKYGPLTYLNVLGQPILIVSDSKVASDLMEKRGTLYSDRPTMRMAGEIVGWENTLILQTYGARFRAYRKHFFRVFGSRAALEEFHPLFESAGHRLLKDLLAKPEEYADAIRRAAGTIILKIAYGYNTRDGKDDFVDSVEEAMVQFSELFEAGGYMVDYLPFLRYLPEWFPGANFQRIAKKYRATLMSMADMPMELVKKQIASGSAESSLVVNEISAGHVNTAEEEHELKWAAASMYSGGADTTVSAMQTFILAMTLFPEAQKKAQAEIDAVVGHDRLPTLVDRPNLPYVSALFSEVLRWGPVVPLGIPHRLTEDDVYEGYLIPKGTLVIGNQWHLLHDPAVYENPLQFNPDRFIESPGHAAEQDPRIAAFGFGRRICPGLNLADATSWLELTLLLSAMNITKALDENGKEITPSGKYTDGTIAFPEKFQCSIKPRSAHAEALIHATSE